MQWTIVQLDCYPNVDGDVDVVSVAHWVLNHTEGGFSGSAYGTAAITLDPDEPFIPYDQLTEDQVVAWVKESLGAERIAEYEGAVQRQIQDQANPPIVKPPLPW